VSERAEGKSPRTEVLKDKVADDKVKFWAKEMGGKDGTEDWVAATMTHRRASWIAHQGKGR